MADKRKIKGKQKIEMKMIEKEEDRITTFSKRKSEIYKKSTELAALCGADVGFVTFSPEEKPFSFAQPSIESIENQLIGIENPPPGINPSTISDDHPLLRAHQQSKLEWLNQHYTELVNNLTTEKQNRKAIEKLVEKSAGKNLSEKGWWEIPLDNLGCKELLQMNDSLEDFHKKLCNHINGGRKTNNNTNAS